MRRLLAAVLLVLAASPLTAPFSIGNALDLFGGVAEHVHAKKAVGDPTAQVAPAVPLAVRLWDWTAVAPDVAASPPVPPLIRDLPLRL